MRVRLRALRSFVGLEGRVRRGTVFAATESRARHLLGENRAGVILAERVDPESVPATPAGVGPVSAAVAAPTETKDDDAPRHVGGGWYEWRGHRYRGKAAADAARRG